MTWKDPQPWRSKLNGARSDTSIFFWLPEFAPRSREQYDADQACSSNRPADA